MWRAVCGGDCAESEQGIFDAVLLGKVDFESDPWPQISSSAKELIRRMLTQNPASRITAHEVLGAYPHQGPEDVWFSRAGGPTK